MLIQEYHWAIFIRDAANQPGTISSIVNEYYTWSKIPKHFTRIISSNPWRDPLYYRMLRHKAKLLMIEEHGQMKAFGWIQSWSPFRRKFQKVIKNGIILGPFWTAPSERGKGYYGKLLSHAVASYDNTQALIIYCSPKNTASYNGIIKANFRRLGIYRQKYYLNGIFKSIIHPLYTDRQIL